MQRPSILWLLPCLLALSALPRPASAQDCPVTEADKAAVTDTVRNLYAAATLDDLPKMHTLVAPTFYIFDNGSTFNSIDSLMALIDSYRSKGVKFVWNVTSPRVTIHCNQAWITYTNIGSVQMPNAAPLPTQWLESVILEKQSGAWKILFFHSTRVPPPEPPK